MEDLPFGQILFYELRLPNILIIQGGDPKMPFFIGLEKKFLIKEGTTIVSKTLSKCLSAKMMA